MKKSTLSKIIIIGSVVALSLATLMSSLYGAGRSIAIAALAIKVPKITHMDPARKALSLGFSNNDELAKSISCIVGKYVPAVDTTKSVDRELAKLRSTAKGYPVVCFGNKPTPTHFPIVGITPGEVADIFTIRFFNNKSVYEFFGMNATCAKDMACGQTYRFNTKNNSLELINNFPLGGKYMVDRLHAPISGCYAGVIDPMAPKERPCCSLLLSSGERLNIAVPDYDFSLDLSNTTKNTIFEYWVDGIPATASSSSGLSSSSSLNTKA